MKIPSKFGPVYIGQVGKTLYIYNILATAWQYKFSLFPLHFLSPIVASSSHTQTFATLPIFFLQP